MTGIDRLYKLSEDVGYTSLWSTLLSGREDDWDCEEYDDKTLDGTLTAIADQIKHEREELEKRLMPDGCDGEFLRLHMSNLWSFMFGVMDRLGVDKSDGDAPEIAFDALDRRLMPEGVEWPRYDTGEPVRIGGTIADELGHAHEVSSVEVFDDAAALHWSPSEPEEFVWLVHGERARRPAVHAGDGEPLEAGQTVWTVRDGIERKVLSIGCGAPDDVHIVECNDFSYYAPSQLTHQCPVLDADGVPIREGDTVYGSGGQEYKVTGLCEYEPSSVHAMTVGDGVSADELIALSGQLNSALLDASKLTHAKPEPPDSAERIADDIRRMAEEWCSHPTLSEASEMAANAVGEATMGVALINLFKRCKALAERERGE